MTRWKSTLAVLLVLWLPFQGYGAVAMPFCQNKASGASSVGRQGEIRALHQHHEHATPANHSHASGATAGHSHADGLKTGHSPAGKSGGLACNNCATCLLACSPVISAVAASVVATGIFFYTPVHISALQSFFPEQPQRPPLSALI